MPKFLLALMLLLPLTAAADVYQWTDSQGRTHFSDKPVPGSKVRQTSPVNTISIPAYNLSRNSMEMRFTEKNGTMFVKGEINGVPMSFVVDTGASLVTVPPAVARRAGIRTEGARIITLRTANGEVNAPMVSLPRIDVDGVSQNNVDATIHKISNDDYLGLLGMSFFSKYTMTIDHEDKVIRLERK